MKVTIIDSVSAWVMEQQIYDAQGRLRARSVAEDYRRDPRTKLYVPTAVRVECPAAGFSMRVDLGAVQVNQLQGNPAELWSMPNYPGYPAGQFGRSEPALWSAAGDVGGTVGRFRQGSGWPTIGAG